MSLRHHFDESHFVQRGFLNRNANIPTKETRTAFLKTPNLCWFSVIGHFRVAFTFFFFFSLSLSEQAINLLLLHFNLWAHLFSSCSLYFLNLLVPIASSSGDLNKQSLSTVRTHWTSVMNRSETESSGVTWMNLESVIQSEVSQKGKKRNIIY